MTLLTDENLFGKFVPKPTISKITLEYSGNPPRRLNPHIDDPSTEGITRTLGIVEGTLDSQATTDNLRIILNLSVKDKLRDLQNSWFANVNPMLKNVNENSDEFDIKDYVTIKVFESKSQNTSNIILSAPDSIVKLKDILDGIVSNIPHIENTDWKQIRLSSMNDPNNVEMKNIRGEGDPNDVFVSTAVGGPSNLKYYDIPFSMDFERSEKYPDYLCYFVWAEFDLSDIADEFDFDITGFEDATDLFATMNFSSQLSHYVALSGGKVPSTIDRFVVDDPAANENNGKVWTGITARDSDGRWHNGYWVLKKTRIENILIQDFRAVDRLNKLNLDFSIVQNSLKGNLSLASKMRTANLSLDPPNKYFTDIMITRDEDENSRFFFSLDVAAIMEKNSPFGNLFVNPGTKVLCLEETTIISMSLHRIRLKGSPEIGSKPIFGPQLLGKRQPKRFNENNEFLTSFPSSNQTTENDDLLLMASYGTNGLSYTSFDDQESSIMDLTEVIYSGEPPKVGVKHFAGVDKSVRLKTDGYYQYRIVIKFEDGAVNYLISQLENLWTAKKNLSEYYAEASKLGTSHSKNPFTNPHAYNLNAPRPRWDIPEGGIRPGNFNVSANRFTQEFKEFSNNKVNTGRVDEVTGAPIFTPPWHDSLPDNPPWLSAATTYVDVMDNLSGFNFGTSEQANNEARMIETIKNYMSPETGNIEGILKVFSLIESLENIISNAIGRVKSPPGGSAKSPYQQSANQNPKLLLSGKTVLPMPEKKDTTLKLVKIDHTFNNIFNANLPKDTGINMFTNFTNDAEGLRTMTRADFDSSVVNEKMKVFQESVDQLILPYDTFSIAPPISLSDTSHTYFTPSIIKTTSTSINLNPGDNANPGVNSSWPDKDEWGRVGISDDMSSYQADDSFAEGGSSVSLERALSGHLDRIDDSYVGGLSSKVASFVGSNYNLIALETTSTGEVREPKSATAFDESVGPRELPFSRLGDDYIEGKNQSYVRENKEAVKNNKLGYNIFSSITQTFNKNGKKDMSRYAPLADEGYINKAGRNRDEFLKLPNPVKALFMFGNNFQGGQSAGANITQVLTSNAQKLFDNGGFGGSESIKMAMRYLFETIFVLEVFVGWQDNRMIEIWEPFTIDNVPDDKNILCRFRRYENPQYGVMGDNASSLPIYDQYFILKSTGAS